MKIYVDSIPEEGMDITARLDPQGLSLDVNAQCTTFIESIDARAKVTKTGEEVLVDVSLEAPCEYTCTRCLAKFQSVFKKDFDVSYEVKSGDILELDEDIRQEIVLDYPMKVLCRPDCKGLCPNCGQNLNVRECGCK